MDEQYLLDLIICRLNGMKPNEKIDLMKKLDREADFLLLTKNDIGSIIGRTLGGKPWDIGLIRAMAERDLKTAGNLGINLVSWRESAYPPLLREIYDPPPLLFYRGMLPDPETPIAAVVGTRKPSPAAGAKAFVLGKELGEAGIPVVSGLALGIDAMAHRGNIEGRAATIAVLGSGPDMIYPHSNRFLARRILETGGLILSEYPPGTRPYKAHFPARNRIISGLARGTIIVEAPEKSGALITARFALDQDRDLWVEKAAVASGRSAGTTRLAEEGAKLISSAADVLAEWNIAAGKAGKAGKAGERGGQGAGPENEGSALASSMAEYLNI